MCPRRCPGSQRLLATHLRRALCSGEGGETRPRAPRPREGLSRRKEARGEPRDAGVLRRSPPAFRAVSRACGAAAPAASTLRPGGQRCASSIHGVTGPAS